MLIKRFMRLFFRLLYHPFAFAYDVVAAAASFGRWKDWVLAVAPFIGETRILELGHGPGHLQYALSDEDLVVVGLDESIQMGEIAKRRLASSKLIRGLAQRLPFANDSFQTIVATFPTDYIFEQNTLLEAKRCLSNQGRLIVLPVAWPKSRMLKWLYRVTGESPAELNEALKSRFKQPFINAGFETETQIVEVKSSNLLIVIAQKR